LEERENGVGLERRIAIRRREKFIKTTKWPCRVCVGGRKNCRPENEKREKKESRAKCTSGWKSKVDRKNAADGHHEKRKSDV